MSRSRKWITRIWHLWMICRIRVRSRIWDCFLIPGSSRIFQRRKYLRLLPGGSRIFQRRKYLWLLPERHRWMIWLGIFWMIWMLQEEQPGRKYSRRRRCLILWEQKKMNYQMLLIPQIYKRILKQKRTELRHRLEKQNRMKCRSLFWKKSRKRKPLDLMTFLHWSRRRKMVRRMICRHYWRGCLRMICRSSLRKAARKI